MGKLFFNEFILNQGFNSTEDYILAQDSLMWISLEGSRFIVIFFDKGLLPIGNGIVRTSSDNIDRFYHVLDNETVEGIVGYK